jgi:hypothetical protein
MWALIVVSLIAGVAHTDVVDYNLTLDDCRRARINVEYTLALYGHQVDAYCELRAS